MQPPVYFAYVAYVAYRGCMGYVPCKKPLQNPFPVDIVPADKEERHRKEQQHPEGQQRGKGVCACNGASKNVGAVGKRQTIRNRAQNKRQA